MELSEETTEAEEGENRGESLAGGVSPSTIRTDYRRHHSTLWDSGQCRHAVASGQP
jgi:hypothetical protein